MKEIQSQRELRGVPLAGGRRSSAIPGTDPLPAVIHMDERGKLFPRPKAPARVGRLGVVSVIYERQGPPLARRGAAESGRFFKSR
jgi:hypothetical protein